MDHFKGINDQERYNNDLLNEIRKSNLLLEQIAQLLQPKGAKENEPNHRSKRNTGRSSNAK